MRHWLGSVLALAVLVACGGEGALPRGDELEPAPTSNVPAAPIVEEPAATNDDESVSAPPPATEPSKPLDAELVISGMKPRGSAGPHVFAVLREPEHVLRQWFSAAGDARVDDGLDVDFTTDVIVYADLGQQPGIWKYFTGAAARQYDDRIEVELVIGVLNDECGAAAALSYPYAFVRVPASDLPYVAVEREDLPDCYYSE